MARSHLEVTNWSRAMSALQNSKQVPNIFLSCAQSNALLSYLGLTTWTMFAPWRERSTRTSSRFVLSGNSWPTRFTKYRHRWVSCARAVCIHARMLCSTLGSPHVTLTCSHTFDTCKRRSSLCNVSTSAFPRKIGFEFFGSNKRETLGLLTLLFTSMSTRVY